MRRTLEVGKTMRHLRSALLVTLSAGLLGCDHATKLAAESALGAGRVITLVPNVLELRYTQNTDVAFSALAQWEIPHKAVLLLAVSFVVLAATAVMWIRHRRIVNGSKWNLADFGYAFVLAGAFGNVLDRLARGYVIDFIHLSHWPIFNVADALIVLGLLALGLSRSKARVAPA
jgi:signal peptidase II